MKKKKIPRGNPSPKAQIEARIARVSELLLNGMTVRQIVDICGHEFKASRTTTVRDIAMANERIADDFDFSRKSEVAKSVDRLLRMQQECLARFDFKTAASIESQLVKIYGLERQQVDVTHTVEDPIAKLMREIRDGQSI